LYRHSIVKRGVVCNALTMIPCPSVYVHPSVSTVVTVKTVDFTGRVSAHLHVGLCFFHSKQTGNSEVHVGYTTKDE